MRKIFTVSAAIIFAASASAQTVDTVSVSAGYVNDIFYSLPNGIVKSEPKDNWDIAFEIGGQTDLSILANTQGTTKAYQSPFTIAEWATVDTAGLATSWQRLDNDPTTWSVGALNSNIEAAGWQDMGWGIYDGEGVNGPPHAINGDSIFVVKTSSGAWKKLRINRFSAGKYSFTYADLDGSNEVNDTVAKADYASKNFAYYSLDNSTELDREPASADWDLLFTKYVVIFYTPEPFYQSATGVLQNKGAEAVKVYPTDIATEEYSALTFAPEINTIGYDWKSHVGGGVYETADSTVYFVKQTNGAIWKIVFTGFGGSADGNYIFTKKLLLEATGINDLTNNFTALEVYPNPASNNVNLVYNYTDSKTFNTVVNVMDLTGRLALQKEITVQSGLNKEIMNVSNLERGIYLISFPEFGNKTQKLIVE